MTVQIEYEELKRLIESSERIETVRRYVKTNKYIVANDLLAILDVEKPKEEKTDDTL